ncbi:MAG TPA: TIGR04282 family arsenosugar biosynthesis glycosyltransferase [Cyclobacteriaceae bacterium]|nr:TIGR04282 family arsenosugar biosynthesis glycosyltransferase [Cyclobacteriaceae bacterium]
MPKQLLIIFYRNPELGKVKTRLAAGIGDEKALAVYYLLSKHTRDITEALLFDKVIFYTDYIDKEDSWSNVSFIKEVQPYGDLGKKMEQAFIWSFERKYEKVCIIGTDCFELNAAIINEAFDQLSKNDCVIGPAKDGGYYLLGMKKMYSELFKNKRWSTDEVYNQTIADFEKLKLSYYKLPLLSDIDTEEDLPLHWLNLLKK